MPTVVLYAIPLVLVFLLVLIAVNTYYLIIIIIIKQLVWPSVNVSDQAG